MVEYRKMSIAEALKADISKGSILAEVNGYVNGFTFRDISMPEAIEGSPDYSFVLSSEPIDRELRELLPVSGQSYTFEEVSLLKIAAERQMKTILRGELTNGPDNCTWGNLDRLPPQLDIHGIKIGNYEFTSNYGVKMYEAMDTLAKFNK